jgi:hypothetical protein
MLFCIKAQEKFMNKNHGFVKNPDKFAKESVKNSDSLQLTACKSTKFGKIDNLRSSARLSAASGPSNNKSWIYLGKFRTHI